MHRLRYAHPIYAAVILALFVLQGVTGISSIDATDEDREKPGPVRRHRRNGLILVSLLPTVYAAGLISVIAMGHHVWGHAAHFVNGTLLLIVTISAFLLARRRRKTGSVGVKYAHMTLGSTAIALYFVQGIIGLTILLGIRAT